MPKAFAPILGVLLPAVLPELPTLALNRFSGLVYRAHHPAWAFAPESGEGARLHGGRFNRVGLACFYSALSINTAWLEAQQGFAFKAQPQTICCYRVECDDVLDLCDAETRAAAQVTLGQLGCAWELLHHQRKSVPSWAVADDLIRQGCAGIVVPSFAARAGHDDRNLVLWSWSRLAPHSIKVIDDGNRLPRNQRSWDLR